MRPDVFDVSSFADDELTTLDEFEKICKVQDELRQRPKKPSIGKPSKSALSAAKTALPPRRKKTVRRRQIDPTTCERDYTQDEVEFMNALNEYKHTSGRMFPTCSEILEVLRCLGYEKRAE